MGVIAEACAGGGGTRAWVGGGIEAVANGERSFHDGFQAGAKSGREAVRSSNQLGMAEDGSEGTIDVLSLLIQRDGGWDGGGARKTMTEAQSGERLAHNEGELEVTLTLEDEIQSAAAERFGGTRPGLAQQDEGAAGWQVRPVMVRPGLGVEQKESERKATCLFECGNGMKEMSQRGERGADLGDQGGIAGEQNNVRDHRRSDCAAARAAGVKRGGKAGGALACSLNSFNLR